MRLELAADLFDVLDVPPERTKDRLDEHVLGVLLADLLHAVPHDPVAHGRQDGV